MRAHKHCGRGGCQRRLSEIGGAPCASEDEPKIDAKDTSYLRTWFEMEDSKRRVAPVREANIKPKPW